MRDIRNYDELKKPVEIQADLDEQARSIRSGSDAAMPQAEWDAHLSSLKRIRPSDPRENEIVGLREDNKAMVDEATAHKESKQRDAQTETIRVMAQDNVQMLSRQIADMRDLKSRFDAECGNPFQGNESSQSDKFAHEKSRYADALAQMKNSGRSDPYGTESRTALAEYAAFEKEQSDLEQRIASARSPSEARELADEKTILGAEYVAYTSHRLADNAAKIHGGEDNSDSRFHRTRAAAMNSYSENLRREFQMQHGQSLEERASYGRSLESETNAQEQTREATRTVIAPTNGVAEWPSQQKAGSGGRSGDERAGGDGSGSPGPTRPTGQGGRDR